MKTTKSPNRLSAKSSYGLVTWIQRNLEQIQRDGIGDKQVAERAGAALGFEVLPSNVRALRGQFGWKWGRAAGEVNAAATMAQDIKRLRSDVESLLNVVSDLVGSIALEGGVSEHLQRSCAHHCQKLAEICGDKLISGNGHTDNQPLFQS